MADNTRQTDEDPLAVYRSLPSKEQVVLQLLAVLYEPADRPVVVGCLERAGLLGPGEKQVNPVELDGLLAKYRQAGLLNGNYQCPRHLVEILSRAAVVAGNYSGLVRAVQDELPFFLGSSIKRSQRCWRLMRELRIAIYSHDLAGIENLQPLLNSQCEEELRLVSPAVQVCVRPFQVDWFKSLPASLQLYLLDLIISHSLKYLENFSGPIRYLLEDLDRGLFAMEERLPFHRLLANYLLWQGRLGEVEDLLRHYPVSFVASGIAGSLLFMKGENERALASFKDDQRVLKKITGLTRPRFQGVVGIFFVLALLRSGARSRFEEARSFLSPGLARAQNGVLGSVYNCLEAVLLAQENEVEQADEVLAAIKEDLGLVLLFKTLARFWLAGSLPTGREAVVLARRLAPFFEKAQAAGFRWPAQEYARLLAQLTGEQRYVDYGERSAAKTGIRSIFKAVRLKASWERSLKALINLTAAGPGLKGSMGSRKRLVWLVDYDGQRLHLTPREQKLPRSGKWSVGRPVALARLYGGALECLTDQDRQACRAIRREYVVNKVIFRLDYNTALPALVGHPLLFREQTPQVPVEFVKGEPELMVQEKNDRLALQFLKGVRPGPGITVVRETASRFKIIVLNDKHRRIARILGPAGLLAPLSAADQVMKAIGNVSSFMTVHLTGAADPAVCQDADFCAVEAEPHIYLQLQPFGIGFKLKMFVKPLGNGGPCLKPGKGTENVMAEIRGRRLHARRHLAREEARARRVEAACPVLAACEELDREWIVAGQEECLELLLELEEIRDMVVIEWPEGEKISVSRPVSLDRLAVRVRKRNNWFELGGELEVDESLVLEMRHLLELARQNPGRFLPLGKGRFLALTRELRKSLADLAVFGEERWPAGAPNGESTEPLVIHQLAAPVLADFVAGVGELEADQGWQEHLRLLKQAGELKPRIPSTLRAVLRDYQVDGYVWLARLAHLGVGACLADDMGLGKTLQALAIILARTKDGPTLVVAPTSVCMNWQAEAARFAPTLNVGIFGGRSRKKMVGQLGSFDVLVTSYTLLQQEAPLLTSIAWQTIVLDEAQAIKNMATKRSRAAMALQGKFRLLSTGTPIENHLGELWNLFNFINPGLLGSWDRFNERFAIPIERHQDREAARQLKRLISPFILRRMKSQVLDELPPRTEIVLQVEMSRREAAFYEALRQRALDKLRASSGQPARNMVILAEIMRLRRACCNPRLVDKSSTIASAKLELFGKVVAELLENRHKVLVFSQFVGHLTIIREYLDAQGLDYRYLDGSTPTRERARQVEAFQAGEGDLFLISLKAGGQGLNLTAADYVIHMDPWWNPAVEDQASDRVHRIGQKLPVTVYRLVTRNTIEEKIVRLHQEKRDLADSLLAGSDLSARVSMDELLELIRGGEG